MAFTEYESSSTYEVSWLWNRDCHWEASGLEVFSFLTCDHNILIVSERVECHKVQVKVDPTKLVQHQVPTQLEFQGSGVAKASTKSLLKAPSGHFLPFTKNDKEFPWLAVATSESWTLRV